ncbi:MAG: hypothetical protein ACRD3W_21015, partial [Terriglobales bacterium]
MTTHIQLQKFRLNAIEAELTALTAQEKALGQISIEHHCGIDLGCNISVAHFTSEARDLVSSLKNMLERFPSMDEDSRSGAVDTFETNAKKLKEAGEQLI